ncbi:MAG: hypothetical protein M0P57_07385 [Syntrophales bacterium]|jgi:hypothetical protein|nr:hypothetical protein [Syntrophales bacterium]MDY0043042.1 hypothetical protein [Syntrophales bacterium]
MNTVFFPVTCYETPYPKWLPVVKQGCRAVPPEVRANSPAQAPFRIPIAAGRLLNSAFPCHAQSGTGISVYESVSLRETCFRGLIVDCRA